MARAAKPAEPRVISAFLSFLEILSPLVSSAPVPFRDLAPYDSLPQPSAGQTFIWMDGYLDAARSGPLYLGQEAIHYGAQQLVPLERTGQSFWRAEFYDHWVREVQSRDGSISALQA